MPRLWSETIESHRRAVYEAALDATATLVAEHGLLSVTMSKIAEATGIGRATLYKYFPDVESVLFAWHERQVASHLEQLAEVRDRAGGEQTRLEAVLEAYALLRHQHGATELSALLHRGAHVTRAHEHLKQFVRDLVVEGVETGVVRRDVPPDELAEYCLHAIDAAGTMQSATAVRRLVTVISAGMQLR